MVTTKTKIIWTVLGLYITLQISVFSNRHYTKVDDHFLGNCTSNLKAKDKYFPWNSTQWTLQEVESAHSSVITGRWSPANCLAQLHLAVMVPYRNREKHLTSFLMNMHTYLQLHNYDYIIVLIEQTDSSPFNRGMLLNIGYTEINKMYPGHYDCFAMHDVDIIPINTTISYHCPSDLKLAHLASHMDRFKYRLPYAWYVGGISVISKHAYKALNGFSNLYFGWGAEDDDFAYRLKARGGQIVRYKKESTLTRTMSHKREKENSQRQGILDQWRNRAAVDGLNSLDYTVMDVRHHKLYFHLTVDINQTKVLHNFEHKFMRTLVPPTVKVNEALARDSDSLDQ